MVEAGAKWLGTGTLMQGKRGKTHQKKKYQRSPRTFTQRRRQEAKARITHMYMYICVWQALCIIKTDNKSAASTVLSDIAQTATARRAAQVTATRAGAN